ncbi:MAG: hypothetical protein HY581_08295 [Nitrospirae bacterium]|nr:hypothetical protein [Nitrospirota bacterium]
MLPSLILLPACGQSSDTIASIALHPTNPNIQYVSTNDAVYKTRDGGQTWEKFPAFSARRVTTVAVDPRLPATIYAGTMGDAVYKSPDGGQRWLPHNVGLKEHVSYVNQFVFDPNRTETIYAATTVGVFRTTDGGRSWEEQMAGMKEVHIVVALAMNPKDPRVLYAGTTGGAYRSRDGAATWQKVNNGLIPAEILEASLSLGVNTLVVDPVNPDTVYAGTTNGLFKTRNQADSWERIGQSLPDQFISGLLIHPTQSTVLYVGGRAGVQKSMDGGQTWQAMNKGLKTLNIRTIVMNPRDPQILYAGTNGSGLYRSTDGAASWTPVPLTVNTSISPRAQG